MKTIKSSVNVKIFPRRLVLPMSLFYFINPIVFIILKKLLAAIIRKSPVFMCRWSLSTYYFKQPLGVFCKKGVLKNFGNFTGNRLCWSLFLVKLQALRCFPVKFAKFLRTTILKNIYERKPYPKYFKRI